MPTLPLFDPSTADPDAYHHVTAPGGYEWWYFDAEDPASDTQIVAIFLEGFIFHPGYLRRYFRYRQAPTQVSPPVPRDYPCAYFVVYRNGRILRQFMTQYPSDRFEASRDEPRVTIGENTLARDGDGSLRLSLRGTPWRVTWQGPRRESGATLAADLTFRPQLPHAPLERRFLSPELAGAEHHWVIANPLCEVSGIIDTGGKAAEKMEFTGRGYHDHNYGAGPIGPGLKRWIWGRILFDDAAYTFHFARASDGTLPEEIHLIRADASGLNELRVSRVVMDWAGMTALRLAYPNTVALGDVLRLDRPRVTDSAPFYMRLMYNAVCEGKKGTAFCEVAYPHRLRWPVLGRMIEMSIEKR